MTSPNVWLASPAQLVSHGCSPGRTFQRSQHHYYYRFLPLFLYREDTRSHDYNPFRVRVNLRL
ncbi:hypothetical protein HanRHA438_Chr05g0241581 [Helianthus annuus]|nr:hypothetical protein HanRHA438_Chr05g0241581 [Helianthus annuus]KAJ0958849.1 hypothetical protein HanPSC8_Chr01g0043431 [Helianthus annuus]